jgi:hypothetical protein
MVWIHIMKWIHLIVWIHIVTWIHLIVWIHIMMWIHLIVWIHMMMWIHLIIRIHMMTWIHLIIGIHTVTWIHLIVRIHRKTRIHLNIWIHIMTMLRREMVLKMRTHFDFIWAVSMKKSYWVTLLWSDSQCVYFVRPNTLLLCIFLFCIFLLYRTDPQVAVQIRILLKEATIVS